MKKSMRVFFIILGLLVVFLLIGMIAGTRNMKEVRSYQIPTIDMRSIADGEYEGMCDIGRWALKVVVVVKDHEITQVLIPDDQMPILPDEFILELNNKIVGRKEPDFDAVTGATISSKAYMIAVTNALSKQ